MFHNFPHLLSNYLTMEKFWTNLYNATGASFSTTLGALVFIGYIFHLALHLVQQWKESKVTYTITLY